MIIIYKNPKIGNFVHFEHGGNGAQAAGFEQIDTGETDENDLPIYVDGDPLYSVDWNEAWGTPPSDEDLEAWEEPEPEPSPVTDVDIARQYQQAYQAAEGIIFLLMGRVAPTLIQKKYCTPENVNAEGTKFMQFHRDIIQDFKNSGRHPDAGDQMYDDFVGSEVTFPWVKDATILTIFSATIPRNLK